MMARSHTPPLALLALALTLPACAHRGTGSAPGPQATRSSRRAPAAPASSPQRSVPGLDDPASRLRARMKAMVGCYEARLEDDPKLRGGILVTLDVAPDGSLGTIDLDAENDALLILEPCIDQALESLRFPPSEDGFILEIPFRFAPRVVDAPPPPGGESK